MLAFKIDLPNDVAPESRAELIHELQAAAQIQTGTPKRSLAETLFVIAAGVQTADILWNWFQKARAKNQRWDVVIKKDEQNIHLAEVTLDELKKFLEQ
jgi:hypothetical protein